MTEESTDDTGGRSPATWWWVLPAGAAVLLVVLTMWVRPPDRHVESIVDVPLKAAPMFLAVLAIAGFPRHPLVSKLAVFAMVVVFMGLVDTGYIIEIFNYADAPDQDAAFPELYRFQLFVAAFVVMAVLFAFRLGGASTRTIIRSGFAAILVVISGLNDLTSWWLTPWEGGRPDTLAWASHIEVFVGGPPTPVVAGVFCAVHLALALVVLLAPVPRRRPRRHDHPTER